MRPLGVDGRESCARRATSRLAGAMGADGCWSEGGCVDSVDLVGIACAPFGREAGTSTSIASGRSPGFGDAVPRSSPGLRSGLTRFTTSGRGTLTGIVNKRTFDVHGQSYLAIAAFVAEGALSLCVLAPPFVAANWAFGAVGAVGTGAATLP